MSRQAVVHHLQTLAGAGLADALRIGREVHWSATPGPLVAAVAWMAAVGGGCARSGGRHPPAPA